MHSVKRQRRRTALVTVVALSVSILNGCHTMTRVAVPDSTPSPPNAAVFATLKVGDNVRITLRNGEKVSFALAEVRADGLVGRGGRHIPYGDMAQLEERHASGSKTAWLIVAIGGAVVLFILISYAAAMGGLMAGAT
jgi:hypothetical protein